jgi:hypothetical protein
MAAVIILQLKKSPKISEFISNIEQQVQQYGFQKVNDFPLIYFSKVSTTVQLNKILRLVRSHPDYRHCVQTCYNNILRIV